MATPTRFYITTRTKRHTLLFILLFSRRFQPEKGEGRNNKCRNHVYSRDRNSLFVYAERCKTGNVPPIRLFTQAIFLCTISFLSLVILDYLLFFLKGLYKALHPLCWLILPYLYIAFTMICAKFGSKIFSAFCGNSCYPYPFLDADLYGKNKVALIIVFITAAFLALGYLSFVIDRLLGKSAKSLSNKSLKRYWKEQ